MPRFSCYVLNETLGCRFPSIPSSLPSSLLLLLPTPEAIDMGGTALLLLPGIFGIHSIFQVYSQVFHLSVFVFLFFFLFSFKAACLCFIFSGSFCYYPPVVKEKKKPRTYQYLSANTYFCFEGHVGSTGPRPFGFLIDFWGLGLFCFCFVFSCSILKALARLPR